MPKTGFTLRAQDQLHFQWEQTVLISIVIIQFCLTLYFQLLCLFIKFFLKNISLLDNSDCHKQRATFHPCIWLECLPSICAMRSGQCCSLHESFIVKVQVRWGGGALSTIAAVAVHLNLANGTPVSAPPPAISCKNKVFQKAHALFSSRIIFSIHASWNPHST